MPDSAPAHETRRAGNIGVPVGCLIILGCFFMPWLTLDGASAMELSTDRQKAEAAFGYLRLHHRMPIMVTRGLYMIPLLALSTLMLDFAIAPGHVARAAARFGILASGAVLAIFFIHTGVSFGPQMSYGFWGSLTGSLFVAVGVLFNVARNE